MFETQHYKAQDKLHTAISYANDLMVNGVELGLAATRAGKMFGVSSVEIKGHLYADIPDELLTESIELTKTYYFVVWHGHT